MRKIPDRKPLQLALGPVLYHWPREVLLGFYQQAFEWPVERVYLGEVVCSKRRSLSPGDWIQLGREMTAAGKQVVISTLTLIEAESELGALSRLCSEVSEQQGMQIEANDLAAVNILARGRLPFAGGAALNVYNEQTLRLLVDQGMQHWVLPLELAQETARSLIASQEGRCSSEIFAWGRLPLAWSARCYTARAENRPKDRCAHLCLKDADGRLLKTQDGQDFLTLNGTQVQSAQTTNLAPWLTEIMQAGIQALRLSPQALHMETIIHDFDLLRHDPENPDVLKDLETRAPAGTCDGYWHGQPGLLSLANSRGGGLGVHAIP